MSKKIKYLNNIGYSEDEKYPITIEYFDKYGNYIGEGSYLTNKAWMFEVLDEVNLMLQNKELPNITNDYPVNFYLNAKNHPNGFPVIMNNSLESMQDVLSNTQDVDLNCTEVKLDYFKESLKFYTDGSYKTYKSNTKELLKEIISLKNKNRLPGITNSFFYIYLKCGDYKKILPL